MGLVTIEVAAVGHDNGEHVDTHLVLGGTGHYGRQIVRSLLKRGAVVRLLSRSRARAREILGDGVDIGQGRSRTS